MKRFSLLFVGLLTCVSACYNPELAPAPFLCGAGGSCPEKYTCYGGICLDEKPECMYPTYVFDGTLDRDLEPNNHYTLATELACGDPNSKNYNPCSCPAIPLQGSGARRRTISNGLQGLGICPKGDLDFYRFFLLAGETLVVRILFQHALGRDLNLDLLHKMPDGNFETVASSESTNDDESLEYTSLIPDYYYIVVKPAYSTDQKDINGQVVRPADLNSYILQYELNPPSACNNNQQCDPFETKESCSDCTDQNSCGNLICETGETDCTQDCFCGNGTCDVQVGENSTTCPGDCPSCSG